MPRYFRHPYVTRSEPSSAWVLGVDWLTMAPPHHTGSDPAGWRYTIGGQSFPMQVEARCRTCRHPRRVDIDAWLLDGTPPSAVAERLGSGAPTQSSILRHRDRHLPTDVVAREALVRERAGGATVPLDEAVEAQVDALRAARVLVAHGLRAIADGTIVPLTFGDVVKAADLLSRTEALAADPAETDARIYQLALLRLLRAVEEEVPPDEWEAIGARMYADPVIKAIGAFERGHETEETRALLDQELAALGPIPTGG